MVSVYQNQKNYEVQKLSPAGIDLLQKHGFPVFQLSLCFSQFDCFKCISGKMLGEIWKAENMRISKIPKLFTIDQGIIEKIKFYREVSCRLPAGRFDPLPVRNSDVKQTIFLQSN